MELVSAGILWSRYVFWTGTVEAEEFYRSNQLVLLDSSACLSDYTNIHKRNTLSQTYTHTHTHTDTQYLSNGLVGY